ncbi:13978_t:CDS:2 [Cetraspora pellucida]|uniref:13978_t:CDS:1 n=1 Tax=Cetraspora pellucida TaxID=1433469 RepID=A0A9N9DQ05_9GLOM|nr:13978_t:CDS:2 [Cetraspora pellucida]
MSKNTHQNQKNKTRSVPILEKPASTPSDLPKASQYLLNFDNQMAHEDNAKITIGVVKPTGSKMFISSLKGNITAFMSISEPGTLNITIKNTRKVESGEYYKARKGKELTNQLIDVLTYKMQQIAANYEKLTTTLAARVEVNSQPAQNQLSPPQQPPNSNIKCYNCGK